MSNAEEPLTATQDNRQASQITFSDARQQILASCLSFTLVIQVGTSLSYSSVLVPQLNEDDSVVKVTTDQASWIAGLVTLIIPVGSLLAGPLMDKYGRRSLSALGGLPFVCGWLTAALAQDASHLYVSRVLNGLGAGFSTVCLVYCSELTHPTYRPMLLGLNSVFVSLGILVTCSLGVGVSWRTHALVYCGLSLMTVLLHWPLPESPHWLADTHKAERSLAWLYRRPQVFQQQLKVLLRERELRNGPTAQSGIRTCLQRVVYRPMLLLVALFMFQQLSGAYVVIFYTMDIFRKVRVQYEDALLIMFGVIRFLMAVVSLLLSRAFGRRTLLFMSGSGMCLSCLAAFLLRQSEAAEEGKFSAVGLCVLVYVCFGALGFLGIPWTLIGELFPVRVKGVISGFMITVAYVFMFAVIKSFPILSENLDIGFIFLIFSLNSLLAVIVVYMWLPETLGVTFSEIEQHFQ